MGEGELVSLDPEASWVTHLTWLKKETEFVGYYKTNAVDKEA